MPVRRMPPFMTAPLLALALLAGCGADGAPTPPDATTTGVAFSGEARIGVTTP